VTVVSRYRTLEQWLVALICLHSFIIGLMLMFVPRWAVRFGGWADVDPVFFARQAGIFHVVLVAGYILEFVRHRGVSFMIAAKTLAVVFLLALSIFTEVPWAVPLSGVADGAMAALVWWVHRRAQGEAGSPYSSPSSSS
jgi:hypothetical protein